MATPAKRIDKQSTLRQLSSSVFALESTKGHMGWKVTDLVRKSGFSRALVYRYLGSSKAEILSTAVDNFVNDFYALELTDVEGGLFSSHIRQARQRMMENPGAIIYYQKWRATSSKQQRYFIDVEIKFQKKLKKIFPHLTTDQLRAHHAIIHGLVTAPFLDPDQAAEIYREVFEITK